jgi:arginyl-tRNA synthetase
MKRRIEQLLDRALSLARERGELLSEHTAAGSVEIPRERQHGDLATNLALAMARSERKAPRTIAEILLRHLEDREGWVESTEIAGPGFVNLRLSPRFWHDELARLAGDPLLGVERNSEGERALVEFISANPTGPLTVGHGRNAVLGDSVARLLSAVGFDVEREYYFNNAGRQMKVLGASVRARYLQALGRAEELPEDGYQGDYIKEIAAGLVAEHADRLAAHEGTAFRDAAERAIFTEIRRTQDRLDIHFDRYFNEDSLYASGAIERVLGELQRRDLSRSYEGAVWLVGDRVGLDKDRVLVKSSGEPAYRLPDIAYHEDKLGRGFRLVVDVLGADHIAQHQDVVAALVGLGHDVSSIHALIYQFVTLTRHGEQVKMSTRRAEYVTLDELIDEVGVDAARFFFLSRKSDSHLEFDLELARKRSTDNPVYYVQYAHARIVNLFAEARRLGVRDPSLGDRGALAALQLAEEFELIRQIAAYGEAVELAARELEPHRITFYLQELAAGLHRYYNRFRILGDEVEERIAARLLLLRTIQRVLAAGLGLLGVNAPERM